MSDESRVITDAQIEHLIERLGGGDQKNTIIKLMTENKEYRDQRRELRAEVEDLKKKIPSEDTVILTDDEVKLWKSYQELGKPEDLKKTSSKIVELQGELDKRDRKDELTRVAGISGFKPSVFFDLAESKGLATEIREIEVDGEKVERAFVKFASDEKGAMLPMSEFVDSQLADYKPSLIVEDKGDDGRPFPNMRPGGKPPKKGATAAIAARIGEQYQTPSQRQEATKGA